MDGLLSRTAAGRRGRAGRRAVIFAACLALADVAPTPARADSDRNDWSIGLDLTAPSADTRLGAWPDGGLGKLRYDASEAGLRGSRLVGEYRGRLAATLWARVVGDWVDDGSAGLGLSEAYLDWRPIPKSRTRYRWRFGAFYPPFSLENGGLGWSTPLTISPSAIDTWLGEEIRPFGAEWSLHRRFGPASSAEEIGFFASGFYGNDPAGTLLFWRGWALHDRQSRLTDRLTLPPIPLWSDTGSVTGFVANPFEPFHEVDGRAGLYTGLEWRYASRALVEVALLDNRADPNRYGGGQWGWHTRFAQAAAQVRLPSRIGLVAGWLYGSTHWLSGGLPDGTRTASSKLVTDDIDSWFVMLSRPLFRVHSLSLRYDDFGVRRPAATPVLVSDRGDAWTLAYRYEYSPRLSIAAEWLRIDSSRNLWPVYGEPPEAIERTLRLKFELTAGSRARR